VQIQEMDILNILKKAKIEKIRNKREIKDPY
jgi:hypothetical protein